MRRARGEARVDAAARRRDSASAPQPITRGFDYIWKATKRHSDLKPEAIPGLRHATQAVLRRAHAAEAGTTGSIPRLNISPKRNGLKSIIFKRSTITDTKLIS